MLAAAIPSQAAYPDRTREEAARDQRKDREQDGRDGDGNDREDTVRAHRSGGPTEETEWADGENEHKQRERQKDRVERSRFHR